MQKPVSSIASQQKAIILLVIRLTHTNKCVVSHLGCVNIYMQYIKKKNIKMHSLLKLSVLT